MCWSEREMGKERSKWVLTPAMLNCHNNAYPCCIRALVCSRQVPFGSRGQTFVVFMPISTCSRRLIDTIEFPLAYAW